MRKPILIAEVKTRSPFGYESKKSWDEQFEFANLHGDWLSIHTDKRWGGSFDLLKKARSLTDKTILAKGIHSDDQDIEKALEYGADFVLVVGRLPLKFKDKILYEPLILSEIPDSIDSSIKLVWNKRDLHTGQQKIETIDDLRKDFNGWTCQASMIKSINDVDSCSDAVLVGQHLPEYVESLE